MERRLGVPFGDVVTALAIHPFMVGGGMPIFALVDSWVNLHLVEPASDRPRRRYR